jgi:hypothetical protein
LLKPGYSYNLQKNRDAIFPTNVSCKGKPLALALHYKIMLAAMANKVESHNRDMFDKIADLILPISVVIAILLTFIIIYVIGSF